MSDKILTIIYGTETGNSSTLAGQVAKRAEKNGVAATVHDMADYDVSSLAALTTPVLFIVSTWDDGLPPSKARPFYKALASAAAMPDLSYTVLGMGDQDYEHFCQAGKDLDAALAKLGAKSFLPRTDMGADFQVTYIGWAKRFWQALAGIYGIAK
ncbi:MAG: flavodoxin domain-containing protein [Opitutales bacterium]|jgi:sulfite reductase (NADPH) flavoprotein alpha-component